MNLDRYCMALLTTRHDGPPSDDRHSDAVQDAHMAHLADLHDAGHLLAAGPVDGGEIRGLLIFASDPAQTRELLLEDPAVRAGWFHVTVAPWMVPEGAMTFAAAAFPRSMADLG
jgi:hypothetical protein